MKTYLKFERISKGLIHVHHEDSPVFLELIHDVNGYWYVGFPPLINNNGTLPSHILRELADYLDEINKPWVDEINNYFDEHPTENA